MRTFIPLKQKYNDIMACVVEDKKNYVHQKLIDLFETMIQQQIDKVKIQLDEGRPKDDEDGNPKMDPLLTVRELVCKYHRISVTDVMARNRVADINFTRQVCMWVSRYLKEYFSLNVIGSYYNRDHATVLNGIKKVESLYQVDAIFRDDLRAMLLHLTEQGVDTTIHFQMLEKLKLLR
jgi:chromosomal replication initiation ATPase DnaA